MPHFVIKEELTKSEINSMISNRVDNIIASRDFERRVKKIATDVIAELFKILWQRKSSWEGGLR